MLTILANNFTLYFTWLIAKYMGYKWFSHVALQPFHYRKAWLLSESNLSIPFSIHTISFETNSCLLIRHLTTKKKKKEEKHKNKTQLFEWQRIATHWIQFVAFNHYIFMLVVVCCCYWGENINTDIITRVTLYYLWIVEKPIVKLSAVHNE